VNRQALALLGVFALGAAVAFPAGLLLGGGSRRDAPPARRPEGSGGALRQPYSPSLLDDPAFLEQQRRNAQALEQACRTTGDYCTQAKAMRRWLAEHEG